MQLTGDCSVTDSKILSGRFQPISLQFIPGFWCQVIWLAEKRFVLPALFASLQSKAEVTWDLGDYQAGGALSEGSHSKSAFSPPVNLLSLLSGDWIKISVGVPGKTRLATFHKLRGNQKIFRLITEDIEPMAAQWGGKSPETRQWGASRVWCQD